MQAVRSSALLGRLPDNELSTVLGSARVLRAARATSLRRHDDDGAVLLLDGAAVATLPSEDGGEVVTGLLGPGSVAGLSVVLGQPQGGTDVVAFMPTEALWLAGPELRQHLTHLPTLALAAMRSLAGEVAAARRDTARFAATSTTERVIDRLVELADDWGEPDGRGAIRVTVPITQEMLASWAHASRESTAKVLHDLRKAGVIRTGRRELTILDLERLRARRANGNQPAEVLQSLLRSIN